MRIAYLEDDPDQALLVTRWLSGAGHECLHYASGAALLAALERTAPDLLLLDWHVPDTTGEAVMAAVRARPVAPPRIVFLSAHDEAGDLTRVLAAGADDHIPKPVKRDELLMRIAALAAKVPADRAVRSFPPYTFDGAAHTVTREGRAVTLDAGEFAVAFELFNSAGGLVTLDAIAGMLARADDSPADARAAQACVSRLRARLQLSAGGGWRLRTVTGVGYRLESTR